MWSASTCLRLTPADLPARSEPRPRPRDSELQVGRLDRLARDERGGALEEVLELAHVARELVVEQRLRPRRARA